MKPARTIYRRPRSLLLLVALGVPACGSSNAGGSASGTGGSSGPASQSSGGAPGGASASTGGAPASTGGSAPVATGGTTATGTGGAPGGATQPDGGVGTGGVASVPTPDGGTTAGGGTGTGAGGAAGGSVTVADPGTDGDGDFTLAKPFTQAPELTVAAGVPTGQIMKFTMNSSDSKFFPTDTTGAPFTRGVQLYIPNGYVPGTPAPFIVLQDGMQYGPRLTAVLDNMIHDGRLPKLLAVLIEPGPGGQRSKEYDTVSDVYFNFIATEVLPKIEADYMVKFTTDPEGRASMGGSSGAPAAMGMAWFGDFHRILTYSGTFVNLQSSTMYPDGAWEYHEHLIPMSDPRPIRIFLEVGDQDNGYMTPASGLRNWVLANQGMAAALKAKGYHYHFVYGTGGVGHVDGGIIGQTLPDALLWLWRGYPH
jgi:enterochelin esterase family protein